MDLKNTPIFIISRNRLLCLKAQIEAFTCRGYNNIVIVDNASTYPPLLKYYSTLSFKILRMKSNFGHTVLQSQGIARRVCRDYYAYTDPDIVPVEDCPDNFMEHFYSILQRYPYDKAGFALKIDDLPNHYHQKQNVIEWENQFWINQKEPGMFEAPIDTTFALVRPRRTPVWSMAIRTGFPYLARHTTWYLDPNNLPEDEEFYSKTVIPEETNWTRLNSVRT